MASWWSGQTEVKVREPEDISITGIPTVDSLIYVAGVVALGVAYYFMHPDQHPDKYY